MLRCNAGYCGLVKVSEDESNTKPASDPSSTRDAVSVSGSASDMPVPGPDSQQSQPPPGMQYAEQTADQPAAVTAGYSDNPEASEQLLLKLTSLQTAVDLSDAGRQGQQCCIADEAFSNAVQLLEKGQVPAAINLLKVAQAACPDNKPQAQARIILLLARCQELAAPKHSTAVHPPAAPPTPAPLFASHGSTANTVVPQPRSSSPEVTDGDAQKAERAFEAGLASLQGYVARSLCAKYLHGVGSLSVRPGVCAAGVIYKQPLNICKRPESGAPEIRQLHWLEFKG